MKNKLVSVFITVLMLSTAAPLFAHHGNAAYDYEATKTVKGVVVDWTWSNPHCILKIDSKEDNGNITHWTIEGGNPVDMRRYGWSATTLKAGDEITVDLMPTKSGAPVGRVRRVVFPDGSVLNGSASAKKSI